MNLEAIGAGGKEIVFQCNSEWVAAVYAASAKHPSISVMAHELFKHIIWRASATVFCVVLILRILIITLSFKALLHRTGRHLWNSVLLG